MSAQHRPVAGSTSRRSQYTSSISRQVEKTIQLRRVLSRLSGILRRSAIICAFNFHGALVFFFSAHATDELHLQLWFHLPPTTRAVGSGVILNPNHLGQPATRKRAYQRKVFLVEHMCRKPIQESFAHSLVYQTQHKLHSKREGGEHDNDGPTDAKLVSHLLLRAAQEILSMTPVDIR